MLGLRAASLSLTKLITNAPLVVVASCRRIFSHIADQIALIAGLPVLLPVAWHITSATFWELIALISAINISLGRKTEELEPLKKVFASALGTSVSIAALCVSVLDIGSCCEIRTDFGRFVFGIGLKEARHDVVHAGLGGLGRHVEPNTSGHRQISVRLQKLGISKQVLLAVVGAGRENVGELAVVVVPGELERTAAIVLLALGCWPSFCRPVGRDVVACWIVGAVAADLLHPVEGLGPELALGRVPRASLLCPVGKNSGQLSLTGVLERPA